MQMWQAGPGDGNEATAGGGGVHALWGRAPAAAAVAKHPPLLCPHAPLVALPGGSLLRACGACMAAQLVRLLPCSQRWRETAAEKRELDRLQFDMINEVCAPAVWAWLVPFVSAWEAPAVPCLVSYGLRLVLDGCSVAAQHANVSGQLPVCVCLPCLCSSLCRPCQPLPRSAGAPGGGGAPPGSVVRADHCQARHPHDRAVREAGGLGWAGG